MSPGATGSSVTLSARVSTTTALSPAESGHHRFYVNDCWRGDWWTEIGHYVHLNSTILVFWTVCLAAMTGCWVWSMAMMRRRHSAEPPTEKRRYRTYKVSSGTITSSEEEGEDVVRLPKQMSDVHEMADSNASYRRLSASDSYVDPGLLRKHSSYVSYTTSVATYPSIRTFFCPHPHMEKLPSKPRPIPLLVFVHGLGGSLAQFHPLLTNLSNIGPCFGIDLPGCGLSSFSPMTWSAYSIRALAELLAVAIEQHRDRDTGQGVVLIAHSLGCSLSALLASSTSPIQPELQRHIIGLIATCPRASPPSPREVTLFRRLLWIPNPLFNLWRLWDRRGGVHSKSVTRFVGKDADLDTRQWQVWFNQQSRTPVWRRIAWGSLPEYKDGIALGGIPGKAIWVSVQTSVLLVAGEADLVTKPEEVEKLLGYFGQPHAETTMNVVMKATEGADTVPDAARFHQPSYVTGNQLSRGPEGPECEAESWNGKTAAGTKETPNRRRVVKTTILPSPASHALPYDRSMYRTLAGVIQDFLFKHVDPRLNLGWQLQYLNTTGKWDVKNLAKWKKVAPVSESIADTFFALKMLREVDGEHNPICFSQGWKGKIYAVIDISHENPVYDPVQLEKGGIHYHKHPTVSKIPPVPEETRDFINLVDRLENEITDMLQKQGDSVGPRPLIGVHCHYGFNRTGFLIVSYLIERKGYSVQDAIDEFERRRSPGIRHDHFIDTLFARYCVGLKRVPTL